MYCHSPTVAYRYVGINPATSKPYKPFKFVPFRDDAFFFQECARSLPDGYERLILPCNKCLLCTRRYRKMWSLRCQHELRSYTQSCYLTLTVSDEYIYNVFPKLPNSEWPSLCYKPFQSFMKRLRRTLEYGYEWSKIYPRYHGEQPVRFYMCGEYGDEGHRPHYHVILFGVNPPDCVPLPNHSGLFVSPLFLKLWPFGFHTIGKVCEETVSYVAGYCDKKLDSSRSMVALENNVNPEFVSMSRGSKKLATGGIGKRFFDRYCDTDLFPENSDGTFVRTCAVDRKGYYVKMPKYYDDLLLLRDSSKYGRMIAARKVGASESVQDFGSWLELSHRKHAVAVEKRRVRDIQALG